MSRVPLENVARKPMSSTPDPAYIFAHAKAFADAAKLIHEKGGAGSVTYVVNLAFAVELYFKALIVREGRTYPKSHKLKDLFDSLSPADRAAVEAHYEAEWAKTPEAAAIRAMTEPLTFDLESVLLNSNSAFAEWRYLFEQTGGAASYGMWELEAAVRQRVTELEPEWKGYISSRELVQALNRLP